MTVRKCILLRTFSKINIFMREILKIMKFFAKTARRNPRIDGLFFLFYAIFPQEFTSHPQVARDRAPKDTPPHRSARNRAPKGHSVTAIASRKSASETGPRASALTSLPQSIRKKLARPSLPFPRLLPSPKLTPLKNTFTQKIHKYCINTEKSKNFWAFIKKFLFLCEKCLPFSAVCDMMCVVA